ncbi:MAG TPA: hypothetical protein VKH19_06135 [Gemmatimonadaceae bacterium]|nr:hypothetical protein [Gemmatimonadaceae bacterium]
MYKRVLTSWAAAGFLALLAACSDVTSPVDAQPIDITLDFCATQTPVWFAYQNVGEAGWTRVIPDVSGTVRFSAARRVAIAYVLLSGADAVTQIIGAANTELQAISEVACQDESGAKQLNGSVTGATGSQLSQITMFFASAYLPSSQSTFSLTQLADRSLDLIASRVNLSGTTTQTSDRVIIRRSQNYVNNATIPALDFNGVEAFSPTTSAVNVSGAVSGEQTLLYEDFFSQLKTSHVLFFSQLSGNGSVVVPTIPAAQTAAGDYHDLFVTANSADGSSFRGAESYFRNPPSSQNLPVGPAITTNPQFTTLDETPYVRLRMFLAIGANSYNRAVNFEFDQQQQFTSTQWSVLVTEGFYNFNPTAWEVDMPDFSGTDGWQSSWGLQTGSPIDWRVTAYYGRPALLLGADPTEGEGIQFAGRQALPAPLQAARAGISVPLRRSVVRR